jgi:putative ABC transport system permease protein
MAPGLQAVKKGMVFIMNLFMIARSNLKKNKSMTLTLMALIIFASILLYIGTSVVLDMDSFLDHKNRELKGSEFTVLSPQKDKENIISIFKEIGEYDQLETVEAMRFPSEFKNITLGEKSQSIGCLMLNADRREAISGLKILNKGDKKFTNSIILPYYLKIAKGYKTGDELTIRYGNKTRTYIVYGFAEDIMFATPSNITLYKCYVYEEEFNSLFSEAESSRYVLVKADLSEGKDQALYNDTFVKRANQEIRESMNDIVTMDFDSMKVGVGIFMIIIMAVLIVFSFIILLIALTVMRFAIVTHIEGNMRNIGSMEALGYTGKELVLGMILQFMLITLISIGIGLTIAASCIGLVTNLVSSSIGLAWNAGINLTAILITITSITLLVGFIAYMAAFKLKKITPIAALRSGIETHNFKKNYFPFHKSPFNVVISAGLKTLMQNMKQNIIIFIIVMLMSFVCVFAFTSNYNFNIDNTALLRLVGIEKSQLMVTDVGEDSQGIFEEISRMEHVKRTARLTNINMSIKEGDREVTPMVSVCNDFDLLEIKTIIKGRYPLHDNEIALTSLVADRLKAKIGDAVTLGDYESEQEFIIVGITQQIMNLGRGASITVEGMTRINPDYHPSDLYVYLDSSANIPVVRKAIEEKFDGMQLEVSNVEESFDTVLESFNTAVIGLCIVCILVTLSIISLILYLLIRIKLLKEKLRIGVSKALGYTTGQLILQIVISFCPVCILGALAGTVMALFLINPAFSAMLSVSGIKNSYFMVDPVLTLITFLSISLFSILVTILVARSIKKITPCELFL